MNIESAANTYRGHGGDFVISVAVSPDDGRYIASAGARGGMQLWTPASPTPLLSRPSDSTYMRTVTFSPDGQMVAVGGTDGVVEIWDVETGACVSALTMHNDTRRDIIWSLSFSP